MPRHRATPTTVTPALLRRWALPDCHPKLGKVGRGKVLAVGGSVKNPGAILLAAVAALRAGAGTLQIATAQHVAASLAVAVPEARVLGLPQSRGGEIARGCQRALGVELSGCQALLVGPGMGESRAAVDLILHCRANTIRCPMVLDAAALRVFDRRKRLARLHRADVIATPHAGEMAEMWGCSTERVLDSPLEIATAAAAAFGAVIVLKGENTVIAAPDGKAFVNVAGNVGLGTSGSGDTLAGLITGLAARGADALQAAVWGVYLHAKAGDVLARSMGGLGFLARELPGEIPALLGAFESKGRPRRRTGGSEVHGV